jgi:hypothetical protein
MAAPDRHPALLALAAAGALTLTGCSNDRNLKITEVGLTAVELHLDEPAGNSLALVDQQLRYVNSAGYQSQIDLFGTIYGDGWLIIWEQPNYQGPPVSASYTNYFGRQIPGIQVKEGFFDSANADGFAYRLTGSHFRYIFPFFYAYDNTEDVVKFGPGTRPATGGAYTETGYLGAMKPRTQGAGATPSKTISRLWSRATPPKMIDTDNEADWERKDDNFGAQTPN